MTDPRTMRITVNLEFNSEDEERDFAIVRAVSAELSKLCESVQETGWAWERIDHDNGGNLTIHAAEIVIN